MQAEQEKRRAEQEKMEAERVWPNLSTSHSTSSVLVSGEETQEYRVQGKKSCAIISAQRNRDNGCLLESTGRSEREG